MKRPLRALLLCLGCGGLFALGYATASATQGLALAVAGFGTFVAWQIFRSPPTRKPPQRPYFHFRDPLNRFADDYEPSGLVETPVDLPSHPVRWRRRQDWTGCALVPVGLLCLATAGARGRTDLEGVALLAFGVVFLAAGALLWNRAA